MQYKNLAECIWDLDKHKRLLRIKEEVDPHLEMAEIQRRVNEVNGPAIFFENIKGSSFRAVSNLFGTLERAHFIFRKNLNAVRGLIELRADSGLFWSSPLKRSGQLLRTHLVLPLRLRNGPVLGNKTSIEKLPQIVSWPGDGGSFITLGQIYSEDPDSPGILRSNLGMYRVQLSGNDYIQNKEVGIHYQLHRGIGFHHSRALALGKSLPVSIFIGGPPAHIFSAVMPLPEGMPEIAFASLLGGRRFRIARRNGHLISTDADFCITGHLINKVKSEGPFGDHLGYYSLKHKFPVLQVEAVYHRKNAIWPFTVVGRPPQEDSIFGALIHEITKPMVKLSIPGVEALHAVDAAGVHPLLLAIGRERYVPYQERQPRELLTIANAILGFGQVSLAKYLLIVAREDNEKLDIYDIVDFFRHLLERVDWSRDLHFQTCTTMDTLDYSGTDINEGSRVVIAAAGNKKRNPARELPADFPLPDQFQASRLIIPGVVVIQAPSFETDGNDQKTLNRFIAHCETNKDQFKEIPLIVLVDDNRFATKSLQNFLWITFTRSNPAHDIHGIFSFNLHKHWGCRGSLIIDARRKPHHAPELQTDEKVKKRVEQLATRGGSLYGVI